MTRTGSIPLAAGSIIAGKYRLEKPLARGGMGSVWVAQHIALDEPVAIKLINRSAHQYGEADARLRQDAEMRLQREAKSAARLRSPHIVQLLDYGVDNGMPYIVMELLEGEHLGARLRRKGRLSLTAATWVAEQVAKALRRAHKAGIIHRDLKPDNIFLARIDDEEIVKLLDFGLVKAVRGTLSGEPTQSDMLMGSLHYMSPEQSLGFKDIDHRSDLWSLGVILFEMLTGDTPFAGPSIVDVIMKIRSGPIPVASKVSPDLPPEIDAFFERALERDPGQRFASARAMVTELSTLVRHLGPLAQIAAGPPPPDSQRITMEISSSEFLEVLPDLVPSSEEHSTPDGAPTERKLPSMPLVVSRPPAPITRSLQLAPTSIGPRAASEPDIAVPLAIVAPPRSRRPSRVPQPLGSAPATTSADPSQATSASLHAASPATATSPAPRRAPAPPKTSVSTKTLGSLGTAPAPSAPKAPSALKSPPPPAAASAPTPARSPRLPQTLESPGVGPTVTSRQVSASPLASTGTPTAAPKSEPPEESTLSMQAKPVVPGLLNEPPKESAFARILGGSTSASPEEASKTGPAFGRSARAPAPAVSATPAAPLPPPNGSVSELIDQGFSALRAGNRDRARQCWEEAWKRDPSNRALELNLRKLEAKDR